MTNQLSIILPLSVFDDDQELTPESLRQNLSDLVTLKAQVATFAQEAQRHKSFIRNAAAAFEHALENLDGMEKAKRTRDLIKEMKNYG